MRRLNLIGAGEDAADVEATEGLRALNDMMMALPGQGIHAGWVSQTLAGTFPLEDRHIEGVKWMLVKKLASTAGIVLSAEQRNNAEAGWLLLNADYRIIEPLRLDSGLQYLPSQRKWWR